VKIETKPAHAGFSARAARPHPAHRRQIGRVARSHNRNVRGAVGNGRGGRGRGRGRRHRGGSLKVVTTRMKPGYLQKNGVPYGESAVLTEYITRTIEPNGDSGLIITLIVEDPQYLTQPLIRSTQFK
jgi:hypothetical protein